MVATLLQSTHAGKKTIPQQSKVQCTMGNGQPDVQANKTGSVVHKLPLAFSVLIQFPQTSQLFKMKEIFLFGLSLTVAFSLSGAQGEFQLHSSLAWFSWNSNRRGGKVVCSLITN